MRSTTGQYYPGLDHLRALAAFLVFGWHFTHGFDGSPVPFGGGLRTDFVVLAPFDEGHCGVALFMTLSGYLFAKLLDGRRIRYMNFIWSRFIRLAPLLVAVFVANGVLIAFNLAERVDILKGGGLWLGRYVQVLVTGLIKPDWPNGGWSITVEMHFYFLLPLILWLKGRWKPSLLCMLVGSMILRAVLHAVYGEVQYFAYFTIIGRIDQFILGIIAFDSRNLIRQRHGWFIMMTAGFLVFYQYFTALGGFYKNPSYPSPSDIWIVLPTIEGLYFGFLIAYYDNSFRFAGGRVSDLISKIGACSYSIYLLHGYVVFLLARIAARWIPHMHDFKIAELVAVGGFALVVPLAWISYQLIERPFFRFKRNYSYDSRLAGPAVDLDPRSRDRVPRPG